MSIADRWLLPDGVEDMLPPDARRLEEVRRRLLDLFHTWGYEYVIPPMVEFLESLLTGTGKDLDPRTLKVVDLLSGRMMGVRADITPQVARIDAHSLNRAGVVRLCYAGTVVQATPETMLASRTPLSVGAELFGDGSSTADIEIVSLMVEAMKTLGLESLHLDLGDVSIFRRFMDGLGINEEQRDALFELVQRKAVKELRQQGGSFGLGGEDLERLCTLSWLCGDESVLDEARNLFVDTPPIVAAVENLAVVAASLKHRFDELDIYFDLSELRGYGYHTGIVFAAYAGKQKQVIVKGGRYDRVGQVFGRQGRAATGFSINVRNLLQGIGDLDGVAERVSLGRVDADMGDAVWEEIKRLRAAGYVVIEESGIADVDYRLVGDGGTFRLKPAGKLHPEPDGG